jgi:hypothetical protein
MAGHLRSNREFCLGADGGEPPRVRAGYRFGQMPLDRIAE